METKDETEISSIILWCMAPFLLGGNNFDDSVYGIVDFIFGKFSGRGDNNVFIGSK